MNKNNSTQQFQYSIRFRISAKQKFIRNTVEAILWKLTRYIDAKVADMRAGGPLQQGGITECRKLERDKGVKHRNWPVGLCLIAIGCVLLLLVA